MTNYERTFVPPLYVESESKLLNVCRKLLIKRLWMGQTYAEIARGADVKPGWLRGTLDTKTKHPRCHDVEKLYEYLTDTTITVVEVK